MGCAWEGGASHAAPHRSHQAIDEYSKAIELSPDPSDKAVSVFYGNRAQCWASLDKYAIVVVVVLVAVLGLARQVRSK